MSVVYNEMKHFYPKKKVLSKKKGCKGLNKNSLLTALATGIKKGPSTSIRKHANELKVHKKSMGTAIKQDLSLDHDPLDYAIWDILKTKQMQHPIKILICLRLLLRKNGIKCQNNLL